MIQVSKSVVSPHLSTRNQQEPTENIMSTELELKSYNLTRISSPNANGLLIVYITFGFFSHVSI